MRLGFRTALIERRCGLSGAARTGVRIAQAHRVVRIRCEDKQQRTGVEPISQGQAGAVLACDVSGTERALNVGPRGRVGATRERQELRATIAGGRRS